MIVLNDKPGRYLNTEGEVRSDFVTLGKMNRFSLWQRA